MPRPRKKAAAKPTRKRKTASRKTAAKRKTPPPKPSPPEPLNAADIEQVFRLAVPEQRIEQLDTRLGTQEVARILKDGGLGSYGGATTVPEGLPYSDRGRAEWWAFRWNRVPQGFDVDVVHEYRDDRPTEVLRQGRVSWSRLANMTTHAALQQQREPLPGEQTAMPL